MESHVTGPRFGFEIFLCTHQYKIQGLMYTSVQICTKFLLTFPCNSRYREAEVTDVLIVELQRIFNTVSRIRVKYSTIPKGGIPAKDFRILGSLQKKLKR